MFSSVTPEAVGFSSKWSLPKESQDAASFSDEVRTEEKASQSHLLKTKSAQTEEVVQSFNEVSYDERRLASFLSRVTPSLMKELDKVEKSKAFSSYLQIDGEPPKPTKHLYTLFCHKQLPELENVKVSCLSWSCTGNVIAIGFQAPYHSYWCTHRSCIHLYNINMHNFDAALPTKVIETESCVTKLAMHPYEPSILAIGTHDGAVEVWHLSQDEEGKDHKIARHADSVTQLAWVRQDSQLVLASAGLDGVIHVFSVSTAIATFSKIDSYAVTEERLSTQPGVTCFAFAPKRSGVFVAALEGGALLHCSMTSAIVKAPDYQGVKNVKDPVVRSLARQTGPVSCIEFSPYIDDMFAVATVEDKFTIYSLNEKGPISVLWCDFEVLGVCWSVASAHSVYAWGNGPDVALFDCQTARQVSILKPPDRQPTEDKVFIPSAAINHKSPKLIAVGTSTGETRILELPQHQI